MSTIQLLSLRHLLYSISIVDSENKETIILGDLNCNYLKRDDHPQTKEIFHMNGYKQVIKTATRITNSTSTLIDVIFTTHPVNLTKTKVVPSALSDHNIIGCVRKLHNSQQPARFIKCRDYRNYNPDVINTELNNLDWGYVFSTVSVNSAWNFMKETLISTLERHAPEIEKRVKGKSSPWLNREIKKEMNHRDQLLRKAQKSNLDTDWAAYKQKRNYVTNAIKRCRKNFYDQKLIESNTSEKLWKTIKEVFPINNASKQKSSIMNLNGEEVKDSNTIANGFSRFFSSICLTLREKAFPLKNCVWNYNKQKPLPNSAFHFTEVSVAEVSRYIRKIKRNKAAGPDNLPPGFLKDIAESIAKPFTYIVNMSLRTGDIPVDFKIAKVTPVYKSGSSKETDNYRPISVLPIMSKILEKVVHCQLVQYLEENKFLHDSQFGFRAGRSTEHAATLLTDHIRKEMDKGNYTGVLYVDLSKAFDTISHSTITTKLKSFGILGTPNEWFINYLFNRKLLVCYNGTLSSPQPLYCGVPQGSIIGPLLFLLHFNDATNVIRRCRILKYADDTVLFV